MLLFIKHNVIIIELWYWYWVLVSVEANIIGYWILGAFLGIVLPIIKRCVLCTSTASPPVAGISPNIFCEAVKCQKQKEGVQKGCALLNV